MINWKGLINTAKKDFNNNHRHRIILLIPACITLSPGFFSTNPANGE
jgi:hypothetical protein